MNEFDSEIVVNDEKDENKKDNLTDNEFYF